MVTQLCRLSTSTYMENEVGIVSLLFSSIVSWRAKQALLVSSLELKSEAGIMIE